MRVITSFSFGLAAFCRGEFTMEGNEFWFVSCHPCLLDEPDELKRYCGIYAPKADQAKIDEYCQAARNAIADGRWCGKEDRTHSGAISVLGLQNPSDDDNEYEQWPNTLFYLRVREQSITNAGHQIL